MSIAEPPRSLAGDKIITGHVSEPGDLSVEQRNINGLAASSFCARQQSSLDGVRSEQPCSNIDDGNPNLHRLTICFTSNAHNAATPLDNEIVTRQILVRPGLAIAGNRAVHKSRIDLLQMIVI